MSWQTELNNSVKTAEQLSTIMRLSLEQTVAYAKIVETYPMLITPYYLSLVNQEDAQDPIGPLPG